MPSNVTLTPLHGIKLVEPGDDLGEITVAALRGNGLVPKDGDVLVVAQKIVSKAEGRYVDVSTVRPSERAIALARTRALSRSSCPNRSGWSVIARGC